MKNIKEKMISGVKVVILGLILATGVSYISAWSGPTGTPPNGNVSAPINAGYNSQSKLGQLSVNTATSTSYTNGLLAFGESIFTSNTVGSSSIQINDGTAAAGKVLTAIDSNGTAMWETASSSSATPIIGSAQYIPANVAVTSSTTPSQTISLSGSGQYKIAIVASYYSCTDYKTNLLIDNSIVGTYTSSHQDTTGTDDFSFATTTILNAGNHTISLSRPGGSGDSGNTDISGCNGLGESHFMWQAYSL